MSNSSTCPLLSPPIRRCLQPHRLRHPPNHCQHCRLVSYSYTFHPPDPSVAQPHEVHLSEANNAKRSLDLKIESPNDDAIADEGKIVELLAKHIHFPLLRGLRQRVRSGMEPDNVNGGAEAWRVEDAVHVMSPTLRVDQYKRKLGS